MEFNYEMSIDDYLETVKINCQSNIRQSTVSFIVGLLLLEIWALISENLDNLAFYSWRDFFGDFLILSLVALAFILLMPQYCYWIATLDINKKRVLNREYPHEDSLGKRKVIIDDLGIFISYEKHQIRD